MYILWVNFKQFIYFTILTVPDSALFIILKCAFIKDDKYCIGISHNIIINLNVINGKRMINVNKLSDNLV